MVKKLTSILLRPIEGLHEAALLLALSAIASQVLALVRDRVFAHQFGTGELLDVYFAAFRIPDFVFVTVASLVSMTILIPFFTEKAGGDLSNKLAGKKFLNSILTIYVLGMIFVSALAYVLMPSLSGYIIPGFSADLASQFVSISRLLLLQVFFLGLSGLLATVTQTYRRFFVYALAPILYNLGIIIGAIWFYPLYGLNGLVGGVILGALMHMAIQLPSALRLGLVPRPTAAIDWQSVKEVFVAAVPRTITLGVHQLVQMVLIRFASLYTVGSIAVFNFAYNLQNVPQSIIGASYSVAAFPTLAALYAGGKVKEFTTQISAAARHIIFWSLPIAALFIVLRAQIVRTLLGTGAFDWTSTRLVAAALALFVFSTVMQSLILLFVRGYYAVGQTKKPLFINVGSSLIIIVLVFIFAHLFETDSTIRYFFESLFRVSDVPGTEVLVLPLAYTVGMMINGLLFWYSYRRDFPGFAGPLKQTVRHSFYSAVIMGFVAYLNLEAFDDLFDINTLPGIFLQGFLSGIFGIIAGVFVLKLLRNQELSDLYNSFHAKFWRRRPIPAPPEEVDGV